MTLRVDVITIFPDVVREYVSVAMLARAAERGAWTLQTHDPRDATTDAHRSVDDTPYGGGAGMVMTPGPIVRTVRDVADLPRPLIALTPSGRTFNRRVARELAALDGFSLLCGRYEGIDQRALDLVADDAISLGDFVLAGGELAALCVIEAVVRLLPGALGNDESASDESFEDGLLEYPQYTKPSSFEGSNVPRELLSGDHQRIARWRRAQALRRTMTLRPDLMDARGELSTSDEAILAEFPEEIERGRSG
jgi:tRNA (guanine37-N1)-methyltransferase